MAQGWKKKFYEEFGARIKTARERKNLTLADVARLSGEQYHTIDRIEFGKAFTAHQLIWMREILDLSIDEVLLETKCFAQSREETKEQKETIKSKRKAEKEHAKAIQKEIDDFV